MSQSNDYLLIAERDFEVGLEYSKLCADSASSGAVVLFVGLVRDLYQDKLEQDKIEYLELQHYAGMTESLCQDVINEARARFSIGAVRLIHRVGKLHANEQIVMVAVSSQHRGDAFQAAQFIMDYLKVRATFWKKEVGTRGHQWLGMKDIDQKAARQWADKSSTS